MSSRAENCGIWGEGFVDDDLSAMRMAADWASVERDEYIHLFPALVPADGRIPAPVAVALSADVARGAAQWMRSARPPSSLGRLAASTHRAVPGTAAMDEAARDSLAFLVGILEAAQEGPLGTVEPSVTARFAFLSGIHPAYLWPSAMVHHDRDAAAGWLGIVARGRPALMPSHVADLLLDLIDVANGRPVAVRDAQMAGFMRAGIDLDTLWRAARVCREGRSPVVRRTKPLPRTLRALIARPPVAVRHWYGAGIDLMRRV